MDTRQLITFTHLAHNLSFSQTALDLDYAQSTISAQIQALESELETKLFDRLGRQVTLTEAGEQFLHYAQNILALQEEARAKLATHTEISGSISLVAPSTLCIYRLPQILRVYQKRYPKVDIQLQTHLTTTAALTEMLHGRLDAALILAEPLDKSQFYSQPLEEAPLTLVAGATHPLASRPQVTLDELLAQSFILTEPTCGYRKLFERYVQTQGHELTRPMGFENIEAIKQCLMAGIGVSFLPCMAVEDDIDHGRLTALHWADAPSHIYMQLVWPKEKWLSPALNAFFDVIYELHPPLTSNQSDQTIPQHQLNAG